MTVVPEPASVKVSRRIGNGIAAREGGAPGIDDIALLARNLCFFLRGCPGTREMIWT